MSVFFSEHNTQNTMRKEKKKWLIFNFITHWRVDNLNVRGPTRLVTAVLTDRRTHVVTRSREYAPCCLSSPCTRPIGRWTFSSTRWWTPRWTPVPGRCPTGPASRSTWPNGLRPNRFPGIPWPHCWFELSGTTRRRSSPGGSWNEQRKTLSYKTNRANRAPCSRTLYYCSIQILISRTSTERIIARSGHDESN